MDNETPIKQAESSDFRQWVSSLKLLERDIQDSLSYDFATGFCTDCPRREDGGEFNCCKETGGWERANESTFEYLKKITAALTALQALIPDGD
jgi:hypothetical protein